MIHALPGMGADRRMYPAPWTELPGFAAHDWVRHRGEQSIPEVAESMCAACGIRDGDILVGSSLGGMVAGEITKIRRIPALFLLGSAVHPSEVSALLAAVHPFAQVAPFEWIKFSAGKIPAEFSQMFATGVEPSFVRAMCAAIFRWDGLGATATRVRRVHGRFDVVIPPPTPPADLVLNGGHLISITHARDCVDFVRAALAGT